MTIKLLSESIDYQGQVFEYNTLILSILLNKITHNKNYFICV
jgi:hypothetical protein